MVGYSHTFCLQSDCGTNKTGSCSFENNPIYNGCRVHKGVIVEGCTGNTDAVVKICSNEREADAAVKRLQFAERVLRRCPGATRVRLSRTYKSQIEKVGKLANKCILKKNDHVIVQQCVDGNIGTAFCLDISRSNSTMAPLSRDSLCGSSLLDFVRHSYEVSGGERVIGQVKGSLEQDANENTVFIITSLTVHSRTGEFGPKDEGQAGVEAFEAWAGIPSRRPQPSAPPAYEDSNANYSVPVSQNNVKPCPQNLPFHHQHEELNRRVNVPADQALFFGLNIPDKTPGGPPSNTFSMMGSPTEVFIQRLLSQQGSHPEIRDWIQSGDMLNRIRGPPPSYHP